MSKITFEPNASGTGVFTIASPNSSTDYTINLPEINGGTLVSTDASGNVGIGTASPSSLLSVTGGTGERLVDIQGAGQTFDLQLNCGDSGTLNSSMYSLGLYYDVNKNSAIDFYRGTGGLDGFLTFSAGNAERMRIDNSGKLLVGRTGPDGGTLLQVGAVSGGGIGVASGTTSTIYVLEFRNPNGVVGRIETSGSSTSYVTSSDYRLKENVVNLDNAADRIKQIPVHRFNFIADPDITVDGFLAHEVQAIVPEAISGTKDEVDEEGNPVYQGIDQSKLVPLLLATVKELEARIAALEAN